MELDVARLATFHEEAAEEQWVTNGGGSVFQTRLDYGIQQLIILLRSIVHIWQYRKAQLANTYIGRTYHCAVVDPSLITSRSLPGLNQAGRFPLLLFELLAAAVDLLTPSINQSAPFFPTVSAKLVPVL